MTIEERINEEYFNWLCGLIDSERFSKAVSYDKLLAHLHNIEFTWFIPKDDNRAHDGLMLRRRFGLARDDLSVQNYITGPCSVFEMMVALAVRCEENIMDDSHWGNRTGQWFWGMIRNLGLGSMRDSSFDVDVVDDIIATFLNRQYAPDGRGGLFTVKDYPQDMRTVEIWCQLSWYLNSIT